MLCKGLHHAAFRCRDARETVDFYTSVLGLKFIHAMGEDHVPSTGAYSPHIHIFFEMDDGSRIAFLQVSARTRRTRSAAGRRSPIKVARQISIGVRCSRPRHKK
jgi:catechol 2,3-dioxygenase-like lactoylglutathione lyase family enzyme